MADEIVNDQSTEPPVFSFAGRSEAEVFSEVTPTPDPVIEEKDKKIKEEDRVDTGTNQPENVPGASPKDIPSRPEKDKEDIKPAKEAAPDPIKFANSDSEKVYKLLKEGKQDEVYSVLAEQKKLSELDKLKPEDAIKLSLQYKNKDLDESDINDLFKEQYSTPKEPVQRLSETDEEFEERQADHKDALSKLEARIKRDAKPAIKELEKFKQEIILPDLPSQSAQRELTQEELAAQKKLTDDYTAVAAAELENFKGYDVKFKGEEAEFPVSYKLSKEDKEQIAPIIAMSHQNAGEFFKTLGWLDKEGNINTSKMASDIPLILNRDKVLESMVADTAKDMQKALTKNIKNIDVSGNNKSNPDLGKTNEEKQKNFVEGFWNQL